jgi:hypothetical protein
MLRDTASALSPAEHKALAAATGARGVLAAPLQDGERIIGAVALIGSELYTSKDEIVLASILEPLSLSTSILFEHQGLLELDHLRREYYLHLAKAVEMPLNRIRDEIQSIYTRLGKLTPYYKQHCETILFEVGKLYEILRDTPEAEAPPKARQQFSGLP